jgi:uncharacterized protein (TIGR02466 family)
LDEAYDVTVRALFPTPLIQAPLRAPEALNRALAEVVLGKAASDPGVQRSNSGGWQSHTDFADWGGEPGRALLSFAGQVVLGVTGMMRDDVLVSGAPEWKVNAWANINRAGDANRMHHHPAAYWSGVYWVAAGGPDEGGELEVFDPRGVLPGFYAPELRIRMSGYLSAGSTDYVTPKAGLMVIFPAWLQHAVRVHHSPDPRISVAFNFSV